MALAAALATWVTSSAVAAVLVLRRFATPCFPLIMGGIAVVALTGNETVTIACYGYSAVRSAGDTAMECDELTQPRNIPEDFDDDGLGDDFDDDDIEDKPARPEEHDLSCGKP